MFAMTESQAREEVCRIGKSLFDRGYVHATAGNISIRLDDGFLITPTDACLGYLDPARLSKLDLNAQQISGDKASKTIALHTRIYASARVFDADTRCVIHTHSTHCVALTLQPVGTQSTFPNQRELLPAITPYFVMKVGHVPLIDYHRPGSPQVADAVEQAIEHHGHRGTPIRAVMLSRLGPNVWHDTPAAAMATLEELEETAKLMLTSSAPPASLSATDIEALKKTFGARW